MKQREVKKSRNRKKSATSRRWPVVAAAVAVAVVVCCFLAYRYHVRLRAKWQCEVSYPTGYEIHGIDVSHYQGFIDWAELRDHGTIDECPVRFVMIKATEGSDQVDDHFERNFRKAREHGFMRGAYHFYSTQSPAEAQARAFISSVRLEHGDLPPVLDVEKKPKGMSRDDFRRGVLTWLRIVERHYGVKPILYTYHKFKMEYLDDSLFNQYPYWIAHYYVDSLEYQGPWKFWQHTDGGHLPGISGDVDFNVYNGSYYDLLQMTIK